VPKHHRGRPLRKVAANPSPRDIEERGVRIGIVGELAALPHPGRKVKTECIRREVLLAFLQIVDYKAIAEDL
jgi:hypothetical protein